MFYIHKEQAERMSLKDFHATSHFKIVFKFLIGSLIKQVVPNKSCIGNLLPLKCINNNEKKHKRH